jgi:hypothetical protein
VLRLRPASSATSQGRQATRSNQAAEGGEAVRLSETLLRAKLAGPAGSLPASPERPVRCTLQQQHGTDCVPGDLNPYVSEGRAEPFAYGALSADFPFGGIA